MDRDTRRSCQLCHRRLAPGEIRYRLVSPEVLSPPVGAYALLSIEEEDDLGVCCHRCRRQHMEHLATNDETGEMLYGWIERELFCVTDGKR